MQCNSKSRKVELSTLFLTHKLTFLAAHFRKALNLPHVSQKEEIVQMVWACNVLPTLIASTKNTQLECRTWQWGQVSGPGFIATLRAYFDTRGPSDRNLKPAPCLSHTFIFYFVLGEFSGVIHRDSKSR